MTDQDFTGVVLRNAFDLWFDPEIKRRQEAAALPKPFRLWAAQVILDLEGTPEINFNESISGVVAAHATGPVEGQELTLAELGELEGLELTLDYPNAGHLTAIYHRKKWYLFFDFRYNAERITLHLDVARQFLQAAVDAAGRGHQNAAVDNLFAAVELMAKSYLLMHPDKRLLTKTKHRFVGIEFNRYGGHGNVPMDFVRLFNTLTNLRNSARFPNDALSVSTDQVQSWLVTAREMDEHLESVRPTRFI